MGHIAQRYAIEILYEVKTAKTPAYGFFSVDLFADLNY
jgi:hypothetical protein